MVERLVKRLEDRIMEAVMAMDNVAVTKMEPLRQQMPLTFLSTGESARVLKLRGDSSMKHHLENLGFVPSAEFKVVSQQGGNYIIEIKGSQIAIDRSVASKIITI